MKKAQPGALSNHIRYNPAVEITAYLLADGPERERLALELLQEFHPYLAKYLDMIVRGHLPNYYGASINEDSRQFLLTLLPKGEPVNKYTLITACKHLHLAFKGYEPAEVYNVLAACLLRVIQKYDPLYVEKVREVVRVIGRIRLPRFTVYQVNERLAFNGQYIVRMLAKRGFLEEVEGEGKKKWFKRLNWPPPPEFFEQAGRPVCSFVLI